MGRRKKNLSQTSISKENQKNEQSETNSQIFNEIKFINIDNEIWQEESIYYNEDKTSFEIAKSKIKQEKIKIIEEGKGKSIAKYKNHEFFVKKVNDKWLPI